MNSTSRIMLAVGAGAMLGAATVHGLHAQSKPKAYIVTESEIIDPAAAAAYSPKSQAAQAAAGGRSFRTTGKVTGIVGTAPARVGLSEWNSMDEVHAWIKSDARRNLAPEREKAIKIIRQYAVEAAN